MKFTQHILGLKPIIVLWRDSGIIFWSICLVRFLYEFLLIHRVTIHSSFSQRGIFTYKYSYNKYSQIIHKTTFIPFHLTDPPHFWKTKHLTASLTTQDEGTFKLLDYLHWNESSETLKKWCLKFNKCYGSYTCTCSYPRKMIYLRCYTNIYMLLLLSKIILEWHS